MTTAVAHDPIAEIEARYEHRLDAEVTRVRDEARAAVEEFKRTFPPPTDAQIESLLLPELRAFPVRLGGRDFELRELPAIVEKKFLRLVEQKLPALVEEILGFEERIGENAARVFADVLGRAETVLNLVSEACVLVLDPAGEHKLTREFVQQHASTARQLRILDAQLKLNGARDFLSQLWPVLRAPEEIEVPALSVQPGSSPSVTPGSPPPPAGANSSATRPQPFSGDSPSAS
jgi:hypothetical protein